MTNDNFGNNRPDSGSTRYTGNSDSYESAYDSEPIDAEIVDDYPETSAETEYRGAHRRDDDSEYLEDVDYAAGAGAAAGAGVAGAAGARSRSRNADDAIYDEPYDEEPKGRGKAAAAGGAAEGGLPKRGLAMILIAVAALLALWGIWKMTQDDNGGDGEGAAPTSSTVVGTSPAAPAGDGAGQGAEGQDGQGAEGQPSADQNAQNTEDQPAQEGDRAGDPNAQDPNAQRPEGAEGQGENGQPAPAPAPAGAGLDNASAQVYVYNNSGTPDLASRTADQLKGQYNVANNSTDAAVMNMPEQVYGIFPETYVFFDPAVPGAEQVAADIARRVGGAARAKGDLPEGATGIPEQAANNSAAVAVVLAG